MLIKKRSSIYFVVFDMLCNFYCAFALGTMNPNMKSMDCNQGTDYIICGVGR